MAKPWAEVAESKAYQALPDEEKGAVQEQYFNSVVAPKVPEQDRDAVRTQFFSSIAPKKAAPSTDVVTSGGMDTGASEIMAAATPKKSSVLEGKQMPVPAPSPISRGVDPKFVESTNAYLNSLPRAERGLAVGQLQAKGGIYAQVAEAYMQQHKQLDKTAESPVTKRLDPRLEARVERKIAQGRGAEGAKPEAAKEAMMGYEERLPQMTETPEEVTRIQEEYGIRPEMRGGEETARVLKRLGAKGVAAGQQGYYGVKRAFADFAGVEDADTKTKLDNLDFMLKNMGESKSKPIQVIEGAAASIIQQAPALVGGLLTRSEPLVLASMFTQSFGQNYDESRRLGMSADESAARSAAFAAFEVVGERLGLGASMKAIKASSRGIPLSDLSAYYAKALAREIPGEELTYAGQFAVDKAHGVNKEAGIKEFIDGAVDTALATVTQAGMMYGGGAAINKAVKSVRGETADTQALAADALNPLAAAQALTGQAAPTAEQPAPAPAVQEEQPTPTAEVQEETPEAAPRALDDMAEQIAIERGIPLKNARALAQRRLDEATAAKVEELTQVYVDLGVPYKEAKAQATIDIAKEEAERNAPTEAVATGVENAGQPITEPSGVGAELAGQPNQVQPAEGFGEPTTDGVVPAGENVVPAPEGEGVEPPTLANMQPGQQITLYRGESAENDTNGQWWTTDKAKAEKYGQVTEVTLPAEVVGKYAAQGHGGPDELVFPNETPVALANKEKAAQAPVPEITVEPAYRMNKNGKDVRDGYDVFINGEWGNRYPTKKAAEAAAAEARAQQTAPTQPTEGAQVGTETPQAVQTTQKGQKQKPAAAGVTPETEQEKESAEEQKLNEAYSRAEFIVNRSNTPASLLKGVSLMRMAQQAKYYFNKAMAFGPDFMYLANGVKNSIPELTTTYELTGKMSGMAADFLRAAGLMQKRVDDYLKKNPDKKELLSRVIYMATVMRYDPADTKRKRRQADMDAQFAELGEEGQKIYVALRDYYRDISDYYNDLLLEMIENLGIDPAEKKNLAVLLRKEYETSKRITPYFPLVRLGDFWVRVGTGEDRELYTFQTAGERDAFALKMAEEFGTDLDTLIGEGEFAVGTQLNFRNEGSKGNTMLTALFDAIDKQPVLESADGKAPTANPNEALKNVVFQAYLSAMPEQSFRKQFMERQDIPGFSTDVTANIAHTATKQALQLARMKYTPQIRKSLDDAKRSLKFQPKGYELLPYVDEAEKRVNLMLSSDHQGALESVVTGINQVSYVWLLSGPATALMDLINVPTRGLSVLTANHRGTGAAKELAKAVAIANRITEKRLRKNEAGVPTMLDDPTLTKEMRYAIGELMRSGVTQMTEVESLEYIGAKTTDVNAGPIKKAAQKVTRGASLATLGFSHYMSKLTREIVFTASYNLSRKEGKTPDEAIRIAIADTKEALGDFSVSNRPRYMQGELGRLAFNLKSFLVNTLLFEAVNLKRMIKADSKEEQIAAATKFLGLWATTSLALGQAATPLYTVIMSVLGLVFESLKNDDWPEDMKAMNFEMWYRTRWIPEHLGDGLGGFVNHGLLGFTGWDLTYRASLDVVKQLMDWSESLTPPGLSVIGNMIDGAQKWQRGEVEEGMKKMLPAILRGPYLTGLMATQGEKDLRGAQIAEPEDIYLNEYAGQVLGFRPRVIGQIRRDNFEFISMEKDIVKKRFDLLDRLDIADRHENWKDYEKTYDEIIKFNGRYAKYRILPKDMADSADMRNKKRAQSYRGVELSRKNDPMLGEALVATRRELDERKRKRESKE